ncbi:type II toxin-antitoxin system HicB family antitoxin [Moraxella sp. ZJ142]|uniref:type II toxin-antitoxin system HicB family antitoxin n=1 Tax=Moraxella marmotae TaxID=3344520 RepID=UPI0035D46F03
MLHYPIAISKDDGMQNYASVVPDVDGCFGFGDTIDETIDNTKSLLQKHIATMLELDMPFEFKTSTIESLQTDPDYNGVIWAVVAIDETAFDKQVRFNVSWSEHLLKKVDDYVAKTHDTRSGFLAKLAEERLAVQSA